ncbi:MAG: dTDP-4-amino-4,6-dideoxygalactose transaminase [Sulfuricaulis sp.]|uniref:dTDP-4-amino-4,6-dideoxygalactose transaminase n=1 Tax=Sulfuricaulis sp. TaxID=2003553 RepID=UPI0025EC6D9C|nr:dTDP-4-amino-4,6-dideoxygalactose transaminase [Sulfuricaulis sp.]MCR4348027.1 dTDP-4-amino-4,6-dideoxygalactose transaminase [Sulfuricaulis sp.]
MSKIPFNRPHMTGRELWYIAQAHHNSILSGDGPFTRRCETWLEQTVGSIRALLTHSCTGALEMAALLADLKPGDEVIMPSYTFVSTANAFVLRGAVPVFVDIRPDTLNLDERLIEAAITSRTRAIVPVHYAGVGCEMDTIMAIAEKHGLLVIADAAQAVLSRYKGRPLGSIGHLATLSFHETKNITSGEGGALLINDDRLVARAEILREKGTNRKQFMHGLVDKYTWVDVGSSYLPGEIIAAFLLAQMEEATVITENRLTCWETYHQAFASAEARGWLRRPVVPDYSDHNAHMYYVLLPSESARNGMIEKLREQGVISVFHYIPLHSSPAGLRFGRAEGELAVTNRVSATLLRLPMYAGLDEESQGKVIDSVLATFQ